MIVALVLVAFGGYLVWNGVFRLRDARDVRSSDPIPIRELPVTEPPLEFEGVVRPTGRDGTFDAPFSGTPSVLCEYRISAQLDNRNERLIRFRTLSRPFVVDDGATRVTVLPDDADLELGTFRTESEGRGPGAFVGDWETIAELEGTGDELRSVLDDGERRRSYDERRLEPGDRVHVYGATVVREYTEPGRESIGCVGAADADPFRISIGDSEKAVRSLLVSGGTAIVVGAAFSAIGVVTLLGLV